MTRNSHPVIMLSATVAVAISGMIGAETSAATDIRERIASIRQALVANGGGIVTTDANGETIIVTQFNDTFSNTFRKTGGGCGNIC